MLAVVGPNGAGKSTLVQVLALLERPARGEVLFDGAPASGNALPYRRRMAVVFQEPLLLDTTVESNVGSGLALRGVPVQEQRRRSTEWLERFGIAHLAKRSARTLSGGEAQRMSLARALVLEPEVLLLDEPFSALDQPTRAALIDDLDRVLMASRIATVFVTHDRSEALRLGDRIAVLMDGRMRQVGSPAEVFALAGRRAGRGLRRHRDDRGGPGPFHHGRHGGGRRGRPGRRGNGGAERRETRCSSACARRISCSRRSSDAGQAIERPQPAAGDRRADHAGRASHARRAGRRVPAGRADHEAVAGGPRARAGFQRPGDVQGDGGAPDPHRHQAAPTTRRGRDAVPRAEQAPPLRSAGEGCEERQVVADDAVDSSHHQVVSLLRVVHRPAVDVDAALVQPGGFFGVDEAVLDADPARALVRRRHLEEALPLVLAFDRVADLDLRRDGPEVADERPVLAADGGPVLRAVIGDGLGYLARERRRLGPACAP